MKTHSVFLLACLVLVGISLAGCVSSPGFSGPDTFEAGKTGNISVNLIRSDSDYSLSRGCYWTPVVQVYNTGASAATNVELYLELIDARSGVVRDTRTLYVGTLSPGESKTVSAELDGDCLNEYRLRAVPILL